MTLNEYQQLAQRTSPTANTPRVEKLLNGILGVTGEAGECSDYFKKCRYQGHTWDAAHMAEEIGDVLWYCAEMAAGLGVELETIAEANIAKLRHRYPDKYTSEHSVDRDAEADTEAVREAIS